MSTIIERFVADACAPLNKRRHCKSMAVLRWRGKTFLSACACGLPTNVDGRVCYLLDSSQTALLRLLVLKKKKQLCVNGLGLGCWVEARGRCI